MDKPIYEIPVTPPGESAVGWAPQRFDPDVREMDTDTGAEPPPVRRLVPAGRRAARLESDPAADPVDRVEPADSFAPLAATAVMASSREIFGDASGDDSDSVIDLDEPETPVAPGPFVVDEVARAVADPDLLAALHEVVYQGASDLHLTVNAPPMLRVDGGLRPAGSTTPWQRDKVLAALRSILSPTQREVFEKELELDFAYTISANARFRVNYYQQRGSLGAAFRLIPTEIKQLKELGIPEAIGDFAKLPRGLVLVTGPTGSGKSTTLAALIDLVNSTRSDHIVTVEDPIEFLHVHKKSLVNQREVGTDTHSFGAALKHVLRQDPDVILIGELRDLETISVALTSAETGHLVFATLHTQDAAQTIDRVIDVFPPHQQDQVRTQLAGTLQGVVSQTLVKKASGHGRAVATEVLMITPAIANLIREGKTYQVPSMMQAGRTRGMHTMDQNLAELVNEGQITHKAALEKAHDVDTFDRLIQRVESPTEAQGRAMAASGIDYGDSYSKEVE